MRGSRDDPKKSSSSSVIGGERRRRSLTGIDEGVLQDLNQKALSESENDDNNAAAKAEIAEGQTLRLARKLTRLSVALQKAQTEGVPVFPGYGESSGKPGGANNPGLHGGVRTRNAEAVRGNRQVEGEKAIFKRDTTDDEVRVAKVIGEAVGAWVLKNLMRYLHGDEYAEKYVANVTLVQIHSITAIPASPDPDGASTYIKSEFLRNGAEDFWKRAYMDDYMKKPKSTNAEAKAKTPDDKPKVVFLKLVRYFEHDAIKLPSMMLLRNKNMRMDFFDQSCARFLFADLGLHPGNFKIINANARDFDNNRRKYINDDRLGSIDTGAAFCNLLPTVEIYKTGKEKTGTSWYKNHFLEYHPDVIFHEDMARALIKIGTVPDSVLIDQTMRELNKLPDFYEANSLKKFCSRIGMDKNSYAHLEIKDLQLMLKAFISVRFKSRRQSMLEQGYGLLLEHCVQHGKVNEAKLKECLDQYEPGLRQFINERLDAFQGIKNKFPPAVKQDIKAAAEPKKISQAEYERELQLLQKGLESNMSEMQRSMEEMRRSMAAGSPQVARVRAESGVGVVKAGVGVFHHSPPLPSSPSQPKKTGDQLQDSKNKGPDDKRKDSSYQKKY